jgi:hypothetical protein
VDTNPMITFFIDPPPDCSCSSDILNYFIINGYFTSFPLTSINSKS